MPGLSSISILSLMITDDSEKRDPSLALNLLLGFFFPKLFSTPQRLFYVNTLKQIPQKMSLFFPYLLFYPTLHIYSHPNKHNFKK